MNNLEINTWPKQNLKQTDILAKPVTIILIVKEKGLNYPLFFILYTAVTGRFRMEKI